MKRVFAFILLVSHINTSMFLPQMTEEDVFNSNGTRVDDINSVVEYIDQVIVGREDDTPEDEDDDNSQNFTIITVANYFFQQPSVVMEHPGLITLAGPTYSDCADPELTSISFDILTPPPEA
jgi:hypothetical protein